MHNYYLLKMLNKVSMFHIFISIRIKFLLLSITKSRLLWYKVNELIQKINHSKFSTIKNAKRFIIDNKISKNLIKD